MSQQVTTPVNDRVWHIERHGTNAIPESDYHGRPSELFGVWFAGNMAIVVVVYGAIEAAAGLNFWQSVLVALVGGGLTYALVGVLSLAGLRYHQPTLAISALSFGTWGNIVTAAMSWLSLVGWELFSNLLVVYTLLALFNIAGLPTNVLLTVASLVIGTGLAVVVGTLGHATLVWIQRSVTVTFGLLTLIIAGFLLVGTHWSAVLVMPAGPWDTGVLATLSIVGAGTGITWLNTAADYTRYLPATSSKASVVLWTLAGSLAIALPLMLVGFLLSLRVPALMTTSNPITVIGTALPAWMAVPYLLTAIVGLLAAAVIGLYSSGLSLLAMGIKLPRYQSIWIDGAVALAGTAWILSANNFLAAFESVLLIISVPLTGWAAIFCLDTLWSKRVLSRRRFNWLAIVVLLIGTVVGLLFTASSLLTGPLAVGIFKASSFGYVISALVSGILYAALRPFFPASRAADDPAANEVR